MIKETVLKEFSSWDSEKQLSEYQGYKRLGDYSPFDESDYELMEMIMNNPNAEADVVCENGICEVSFNEEEVLLVEALKPNKEALEKFELILSMIFETNSPYENFDYMKVDEDIINDIEKLAKDKTHTESDENDIDLIFDKGLIKDKGSNTIVNLKKQFAETGTVLKLDRNPKLTTFMKDLGTKKVKVSELLDYPIFNILMFACNTSATYNQVITALYKDAEHAEFVIKQINRTFRLFTKVRKQSEILYKRFNNPEKAQAFHNTKKQKEVEIEELTNKLETVGDTVFSIEAEIVTLANKKKPSDEEKEELKDLRSNLKIQRGFYADVSSQLAMAKSVNSGADETELDYYNESETDLDSDIAISEKPKGTPKAAVSVESDSELQKDLDILNLEVHGVVKDDIRKMQKYFDGKSIESSLKDLNSLLAANPAATKRIKLLGTDFSPRTIDLLHRAFDSEGKGYGKGELFFVYTMGSTTQGGGESFDVSIKAGDYEVKSYDLHNGKMESAGIRLGSYGNMNNFDEFNQLSVLLKTLQNVFGKNYGTLNSMYRSASFNKDFSELLNSKSKAGYKLVNVLKSGEITPKNLEEMANAIDASKTAIAEAMDAIEANDYKIVELFGEGISDVKYILDDDTIPSPVEKGDGMELNLKVKEFSDELKYDFIKNIRELRKLPSWNDDNFIYNALKDINAEIMNIMKDHKLVLLSNKKAREIYGVYDSFVISKITQGVVRIIPSGLEPKLISGMYFRLSK